MMFQTHKKILIFSTILILLLGISWIAFSSVVYKQYYLISYKFSLILVVSIIIGNLLVLWAILGIVAIQKKSNSLLKVYAFGLFIFLLISIAFLAIGVYVQIKLHEFQNDTNCTQKDIFIQLYKLNSLSYQTLCKNSCKCNFEGNSDEAFQRGIINYDNNDTSPLQVQECEEFNHFNIPEQQNYSDLLQVAEEVLGCSGVCSINSYFVFSDVNAGQPKSDCKQRLIDLINENNIDLIIGFSVITFILILNIVLSIILFSQQPKGKIFQKNIDGLYFVNNQMITVSQ
ncbi:tetraspanin family protein (macronuclear) [Tetrahymena thermophila SB210]|uniref:Tetraspanin family protein n=1 Tax=Tetrahymena thermophila (strain SB210) TaxID=312017 RepID=W7WWS3_TETTS|nr:tetraspanin family protein [Tetrahymena thermophila SB210]EWS71265.1 tetraspanin family protein [Tetrahymena thermophila SB210]|eukprot:XP_012656197.1 tetraspanin family protein [Tetrahymena thermophila SB210]